MRMVTWPGDIGVATMRLPTGPNVYRSGVNESVDASQQAYAGVGGRLHWRYDFARCQGGLARVLEGALTDAAGGANVIRMPWLHGQRRTGPEISATLAEWDEGATWDSGMHWGVSPPLVNSSVVHPVGYTQIRLNNEHWGHKLGRGDWFGFTGVFGAHRVTEVVQTGLYRVWPAMRAVVTPGVNFATLEPVVACTVKPGSIILEEDSTALTGSAEFVEFLHGQIADYVTQ